MGTHDEAHVATGEDELRRLDAEAMEDDDLDDTGGAEVAAEVAAERTRRRMRRVASQVYSIRVPVDRLEDLRQLAAARGEAPTALMRQWVLERLDAETLGDGPSRYAAAPHPQPATGSCLAGPALAGTLADLQRAAQAVARAAESLNQPHSRDVEWLFDRPFENAICGKTFHYYVRRS